MPVATEGVGWYETHAARLAAVYEALDPERVHGWLVGLLPAVPALVLDVGAGSGRDAAWLNRLGHEVIAVEPSAAMRAQAICCHPVRKAQRCENVR